MPDLIKLYIRSALWGLVLAAIFVGMLMWFNVMNLWSLISGSNEGVIALLALWIANAIVFGAVQFAWAIMDMAEDDDDEPRGGTKVGPQMQRDLVAIPVRSDGKSGQARQLRRR
ncbi:hypothetical protein TRM7557_00262 [Tritonibacter multivorans]|uniref:Uncharacterized protein n=1 Tax=Tritonibacter multivorans TaxID=928856 RepID=A0A0P1G0U9_9RHOB|nr:hypothetical protein [Tritonibacter multivorans]MDA7419304.1 hypothetical protein [Tritonibacter multivorans]CUH75191.1 hypothetical protein TRM7557_00262 [Tritonibacter multivorans]SFD23004.1 hypothetical protein SAMN04488049_10999 [Tritonibacter multivorans]